MKRIIFLLGILSGFIFWSNNSWSQVYEQSNDTIYKVIKIPVLVNTPQNLSFRDIYMLQRDGIVIDTNIVDKPMSFPWGILFKNKYKVVSVYELANNNKRIYTSEKTINTISTFRPNFWILSLLIITIVISIGIAKTSKQLGYSCGSSMVFILWWIICTMVIMAVYAYPETVSAVRWTPNLIGALVVMNVCLVLPFGILTRKRIVRQGV